jgi:hypothetical protein
LRAYLNDSPNPNYVNKQDGNEHSAHWENPVKPGAKDMTTMPFTRKARHVEQRFTERHPYPNYPNWILPGSEAIMPKKSAPLNLWDDERDLKTGNLHYKPIYDPSREMYVQTPQGEFNLQTELAAESAADLR